MSKTKTISIITPTFNSQEFLEETLLSVLLQKGNFNIDYFIVDGKSTDKTIDIIKKYEKLVKQNQLPRLCNKISFKWISEKDNRMYDAINKGLQNANGEYMAYINSDDQYLPGAFQTITQIFSQYPQVQWITGKPTFYNKYGVAHRVSVPIGYNQKFIEKGYYSIDYCYSIQQESSFWTKKLWDSIGGSFNSQYRLAGDFELWTRFAKHSPLYQVDAQLSGFRIHEKQQTANRGRDAYMEEIHKHFNYKLSIMEKILLYLLKRKKAFLLRHSNIDLPIIYWSSHQEKWIIKND